MNKKIKDFIKMVRKDCEEHGVTLCLSRMPYVKHSDGISTNGFFDDEPELELAVATGKNDELWFPTLVHEYCHMQQWKEKDPLWEAEESEEDIFEWINGNIELTDKKLSKLVNEARALELDCEKRTVEMIKKHDLGIDIDHYIKKANAYLLFWTYLKESRQWYEVGKEPYNIPEILEVVPKKFVKDYNKISKKALAAFRKYL